MSDPAPSHNSEQKRVAASSLLAAVLLTATKLTVGLFTGSLGILSEALHSALDLLAAAMTWFAVHVSGRPADRDHLYGHHKVDNLSALFETILLLATCAWIVYEAVERLFFKTVVVEVNAWSFAVIALAIVVDFSRSRALLRVARRTRSAALEADALHFSSDIWSSLMVLCGLVFTMFGYPQADSVGALGVSVVIVVIALRLGRRAVDALVDRSPEDHAARAAEAALSVTGVRRAYDARIRHAGPRHFVDLKIATDPKLSLAGVHELTEQVESAVRRVFADADVVVHPEPDDTASLRLSDVAALLAERVGARSHAVSVHTTAEGREVDLHLEWPSETSFAEAHRRGSEVENQLRSRYPDVNAVRAHLEVAGEVAVQGHDVTEGESALASEIARTARLERDVVTCPEVRMLARGDRLWVTMTCGLAPIVSLARAHQLATAIEKRVLALSSRIEAVHVHTEPSVPDLPERPAS
jgi:cation diffusion facilitator family transporter